MEKTQDKRAPQGSDEELSPYTIDDEKHDFTEHTTEEAGYKSPYVTDEPAPDKRDEETKSPYTEPDEQKPEVSPGKEHSPYTTRDSS